jgi:hypothetical protein
MLRKVWCRLNQLSDQLEILGLDALRRDRCCGRSLSRRTLNRRPALDRSDARQFMHRTARWPLRRKAPMLVGATQDRRRSSFVQSTFRGLNLPASHGRLNSQQAPANAERVRGCGIAHCAGGHLSGAGDGLPAIRPRFHRQPRLVSARAFDTGKAAAPAARANFASRLSPAAGSANLAPDPMERRSRRASLPPPQTQSTAVPELEEAKLRSLRGTVTAALRCWFHGLAARDANRALLARAGRRLPARSARSAPGETACAGWPPRSDVKAPNFPTRLSSSSRGSRPMADWRACFPLFDAVRPWFSSGRFSGAERSTASM